MKVILVIEPGSGQDVELDHETIQTITDALRREQLRAVKTLAQFPPLYPSPTEMTPEEHRDREKVLTWHSMCSRALELLS